MDKGWSRRNRIGKNNRLLKGAKPAELPVEQPTSLQFLLNLKVAKALEVPVPAQVLALAAAVVE
jgi:putative ABC transport system substrate-binding protein